MPIVLSTVFFALALYFITVASGFLAAIFLILSLIAFMNHSGGGPKDDDQRPA